MSAMRDLMERFCEEERIFNFEGQGGLVNLIKIIRVLGYKDPHFQMQLTRDAAVGDLLLFLEDNPGALEALYNWIAKQKSPEWQQRFVDVVPSDEDEEDDDAEGEEENVPG